MDNITKTYIFLYKLKKHFKAINLAARLIIFILLAIVIGQQLYYPREIENQKASFKSYLGDLRFSFGNISSAMEDFKAEVEDFNADKWRTDTKGLEFFIENMDDKISYFESSIGDYFSPSRMKHRKLMF